MVFFFQAEDGIRDKLVTGVQTCALPIYELLRWVPRGIRERGSERWAVRPDLPASPTHVKRVSFSGANVLSARRRVSRWCGVDATPRSPGSIRSGQVPTDGYRHRRCPSRSRSRECQRPAARAAIAPGSVRLVLHAARLGTGGG